MANHDKPGRLLGCRFESLVKGVLCSIRSSRPVHPNRVGARVGGSLPVTCYKACRQPMHGTLRVRARGGESPSPSLGVPRPHTARTGSIAMHPRGATPSLRFSNYPAFRTRFHRDRQDHRDCRDRRKRGYRSHTPLSARLGQRLNRGWAFVSTSALFRRNLPPDLRRLFGPRSQASFSSPRLICHG